MTNYVITALSETGRKIYGLTVEASTNYEAIKKFRADLQYKNLKPIEIRKEFAFGIVEKIYF